MSNVALSIFDTNPAHPVQAILDWLDEARAQDIPEPTAVSLATANSDGIASNRIVQILNISDEGLVFASHINSPKGLDISLTHWGSCVFYWPQLNRQIIVAGSIDLLEEHKSDALWATRPPEAQAMSTVSTQSAPLLDSEEILREKALAVAASEHIIRPAKWVGYCLHPRIVEFWQFSADRLYKRLKYTTAEENWLSVRLQP